jgi:hypothetical protein
MNCISNAIKYGPKIVLKTNEKFIFYKYDCSFRDLRSLYSMFVRISRICGLKYRVKIAKTSGQKY